MDFKDRRTQLVIAGAAAALLAGLLLAVGLTRSHGGDGNGSPPASEGGLVIDSSGDDGKLDPAKPLRCFVAGQFAGELTLAECAKRNGVATGALDVGVDAAGALAAADQAGTVLTPLPPPATVAGAENTQPVAGETGGCWRYVNNQWRREPADMPLQVCVATLFAGRCERAGGATYGRWGQQTLRLVPGRVEISGDNQSFRPLAQQAQDCSIGAVG
jgi:hypothetical protein